jgi:7-cyano-7-deazaguanine synthase in queuosine biosynthesis
VNISSIAIGIIKSERGYPDTSSNFIDKTENILSFTFDREFHILTPMIEVTKREEIVEYNALDLRLDLTYSCQKGYSKGCKGDIKCDSCKELNDAISWYNANYS